MINNNPYNIPERPLKPNPKVAKIPQQGNSIYNLNEQQNGYCVNSRFVNRNEMGSWAEHRVSNQCPGVMNMVNTRHVHKPMVNMHMSPSSHNYQTPGPDRIVLQLMQKINKVNSMVEIHDRTINSLVQAKNHDNKLQESIIRDISTATTINNSMSLSNQLETMNTQQEEQIKKIHEEIQTLKNDVHQKVFISNPDVKQEINALVNEIISDKHRNTTPTKQDTNLNHQIADRITKQTVSQIKAIKDELNFQINRINDTLTKVITELGQYKEAGMFKPSILKCSGTSVMLRYSESFQVQEENIKQKSIPISESVYYIDKNGYLLDSQKHYILDPQNKQVRLQQVHIKLLRQNGVIV